MSKDLAYYRSLPYEREWLPRDDESGRYFVVRLKDIPEIYGVGETKQEALAQLWSAFDDQITWCLEEGVEIPEPPVVPRSIGVPLVIHVTRIASVSSGVLRPRSDQDAAVTGAGRSEAYGNPEPIDVAALVTT